MFFMITCAAFAQVVTESDAVIVTGTGGSGYMQLPNQSSAPGTPTSAARLFFDSSNRFSWKGINGYVRTFDSTANTADRVYTLPDLSGTVALSGAGQSVSFSSITASGQTIIGSGSILALQVGAASVLTMPTIVRTTIVAPQTGINQPTIALTGAAGGYGAGIDFNSALSDATSTYKTMARIVADGSDGWNTTAGTQDAALTFWTSLNGTLTKGAGLSSDGNLSIYGTGTSSIAGSLKIGSTLSVNATGSILVQPHQSGSAGQLELTTTTSSLYKNDGTVKWSVDNSGNSFQSGYISTGISGYVRHFGQQLYKVGTASGSAANLRWDIETSGSETGSNVGSDYVIFGYDDSGTYLSNPLTIKRTGAVAVAGTSSLKGIRTATATFNFGTVAAGGTSSQMSVTITGVASGDSIMVDDAEGNFFPGAALIVEKSVGGNAGYVRLKNPTAGDIVVGSKTLRITVFSF